METKVAGVTTFGPHAGGERMSQFTTEAGLTVSVRGSGEESTEPAFRLACELSRSAAVIADQQAEIARIRSALEVAVARIPPHSPARLLGIGYVRFRDGTLWLLGHREKGWAAFGYQLTDWDDLFRRYNVRVIDAGTDEHGAWWAVQNCTEAA